MTNNTLDYIHIFLNERLPVKLYKQFLDYPNIKYSIANIKKPRSKKLDVFVLSIEGLSTISKIIIFIDSINERIALPKYLHIKLLDNLKNKEE